jgi:ribosomal protein S18 acetylase RimI-like enzyme
MTALAGETAATETLLDVVPAGPRRSDAQILQWARSESVSTSPEAFLSTVAEIDEKPEAYWKNELRSSTWLVVEDGDKVLAIAAAKRPDDRDKENITNSPRACFIESVWIAPSVRRRGLGTLLVKYLVEIQRSRGIQDFYLWVFDKNRPAIELYERLGFRPTGLAHVVDKPVRRPRIHEIQYVLMCDRVSPGDSEKTLGSLERDLLSYGVSYRLLG